MKKRKLLSRDFNNSWLQKWPWLKYEDGKMTCKICVEGRKENTMSQGCTNFRASTLERHVVSADHRRAVSDKVSSQTMLTMMSSKLSDNDQAQDCPCP